jgi:saxitoxin biosynthesis operon SxtJ-like protein
MQWSDLPLNPSTRTLRQFAGLWILFMGGSAIWQYLAHGRKELALVLGVLALVVGPVGLLFPRALRPLFVTWLAVAFPIGWTVSRIILMILFFGVITPVAVVCRLFGRDVLKLRRQPQAVTYWMPKERPVDVASYFRQF